jgi:hypothetical protein
VRKNIDSIMVTDSDDSINTSVELEADDSFENETPVHQNKKIGNEFEMVNLKSKEKKKEVGNHVMKEFQVAGKVNQSAKKREKRKVKKH